MLRDTSVVVDIDRGGVDDAVTRLDDEGRHAISVVTVTELRLSVNKRYTGTDHRPDALESLDRLARFDILPVSRPVATAAGDIIADLHGRGAPLNDLHGVYIAATGMTEQLPVLTANIDHFDRIEDLPVIDWAGY